MDFKVLYDNYLSHTLKALLSERLKYMKAFDNVSVECSGTELSIRWFGNEADPEGKNHFSTRGIPLNYKHVSQEIDRQYYKLTRKV